MNMVDPGHFRSNIFYNVYYCILILSDTDVILLARKRVRLQGGSVLNANCPMVRGIIYQYSSNYFLSSQGVMLVQHLYCWEE